MIYILVILIMVIFVLLAYLFFIKKELKRISEEIEIVRSSNSNNLVHNEYRTKEISLLTNKINSLIVEIKQVEQEYGNKDKALMKMITNISHDLRTPLTSAIGYINLIQTSSLSKEEEQFELKTIEERLKKLESLINSFFEFSKILSSNETLTFEKTNLNMIIENCIASHYEDFQKEDRKIVLTTYSNKIDINSNKKLLTRIFDNLIENAYKHSTSDLEIEIKKKDKIQINFSNNLLYNDLDTEKMFNEFYTVDISRTKGNTGLGLAIAKDFTEQLNGEIYANKRKDKLTIVIEF